MDIDLKSNVKTIVSLALVVILIATVMTPILNASANSSETKVIADNRDALITQSENGWTNVYSKVTEPTTIEVQIKQNDTWFKVNGVEYVNPLYETFISNTYGTIGDGSYVIMSDVYNLLLSNPTYIEESNDEELYDSYDSTAIRLTINFANQAMNVHRIVYKDDALISDKTFEWSYNNAYILNADGDLFSIPKGNFDNVKYKYKCEDGVYSSYNTSDFLMVDSNVFKNYTFIDYHESDYGFNWFACSTPNGFLQDVNTLLNVNDCDEIYVNKADNFTPTQIEITLCPIEVTETQSDSALIGTLTSLIPLLMMVGVVLSVVTVFVIDKR